MIEQMIQEASSLVRGIKTIIFFMKDKLVMQPHVPELCESQDRVIFVDTKIISDFNDPTKQILHSAICLINNTSE